MVKLKFENSMSHYMEFGKVCFYYILENYFLRVCQIYPVIQVSVLVTAKFISLDRVLPCKGKGEVSMLTKHHAIMTCVEVSSLYS